MDRVIPGYVTSLEVIDLPQAGQSFGTTAIVSAPRGFMDHA
jgi:hypothetical protein